MLLRTWIGSREGNLPVLPASKEAESPSNLFYVDSMRGGGGGLEVVKSKVRGEINFWKSLESSSAEGGEITTGCCSRTRP